MATELDEAIEVTNHFLMGISLYGECIAVDPVRLLFKGELEFLLGRQRVAFGRRVGAQALETANAFDQSGEGLQNEHEKTGRDHEAGGLGAVRHFTRLECMEEDWPGKHRDGDGHRRQKEKNAEIVNRGFPAPGESRRNQADADMLVAHQGIAHAVPHNSN